MMNTIERVRLIGKPIVFALSLVPFAMIAAAAFLQPEALGANPVEEIQDQLGNWGLRFILIALAVTPLRKLTGWNWLTRFRRMLGLFAFFYVLMHFLVWMILDQGLLVSGDALAIIVEDIVKRPFITIGMLALVLLLAMAATSTNAIRRRMGRNWDRLHYSAYVVGILAVWHYWWQVKLDATEPLIYAVILAALLGYRVAKAYQTKPSVTLDGSSAR